jgi:Glycosyl hydrolases family 39
MRLASKSSITFATTALLALAASAQPGPAKPNVITIDWNKTVIVSKSTPTLQVVVNPMTRPGSPIHDQTFAALKSLGADYVRYVPWEPYPKLAVAELDPPTSSSTSWNFSLIDPMTKDFLNATEDHPTVMNFSTIPAWMFKTDKPVAYPADPNQVVWNYTQGTELRDPSGQQVADYYARLVSWYTQGGFTDENGKSHDSGYHYHFPVWEVLNEIDFEHQTTPELYTQRYDAIVDAIHKVSPETKFMGLALAQPQMDPRWFTYFLDHTHHAPGTPIDYISYHFYATPLISENLDDWQYTFFDQADRFLTNVRYVEEIRKRLSPETKTDLDELGVILPTDKLEIRAGKANPDQIPALYWNAAGSLYAYLFVNLSKQGIDIIGESQLVGYPSQFPSVSMMNWKNGKPNARYWVLKLIKDNFHSGDKLVKTEFSRWSDIHGQAFETPQGHKLLLLNRHNRPTEATLPAGITNYTLSTVDGGTGDNPPRVTQGSDSTLTLAPFAVAVLSWK